MNRARSLPALLLATLALTVAPATALAQVGCSGGGCTHLVGVCLLLVVAIGLMLLIALPLGILGLILLPILVGRGIIRRSAPWLRVGVAGFPVAMCGVGATAWTVLHVGVFHHRLDLVSVPVLVLVAAALQGLYLYLAVSGLRSPRLPGA